MPKSNTCNIPSTEKKTYLQNFKLKEESYKTIFSKREFVFDHKFKLPVNKFLLIHKCNTKYRDFYFIKNIYAHIKRKNIYQTKIWKGKANHPTKIRLNVRKSI